MQQHPETPFDTLNDWLAWLETLSPREIDLGLERVQEVMGRLELGRPARVVHVAGTNGKGSCAAMLESLFRELGGTVGCYTSPHIVQYNERIRVDGAPVGDAEIVAAFARVEALRQGVPLTYFEYGTLAALVVFERAGAESLVLEIGMGGRLDAVNAVEPDAGIVTNVTLDHCDWLGPDVETIAREKAGIMRAGRPLVFGSEAVPRAIESEAERIGADLRLAGRDFGYARGDESRWRWRGRAASLDGLAVPALYGSVQLRNASAVLAACEAMSLGGVLVQDTVNRAFGRISVPGRFQWLEAGRGRRLLDVAHNPDAARVLGESLGELAHPGPVTAIIGVLADKDAAGIVDALQPRVDNWIAVTPASPRAIAARELASLVANRCNKPCLVMDTPADALRHVNEHASGNTLVLVTGSFYTVGPALTWLQSADAERSR
ncbi:MAG TPA: folylpolyglutamate synthase/dihydrofolate synthase family protein [Woeseiaceae bacterium]|nr:folylpolyglutamate synthase/dihydrofolate synthase family protein [Woeseiaceae bacterium]